MYLICISDKGKKLQLTHKGIFINDMLVHGISLNLEHVRLMMDAIGLKVPPTKLDYATLYWKLLRHVLNF